MADNSVLQFEYNDHMFASALLQLAQKSKALNPTFTLKASGENQHLYNRIQWMMGNKQRLLPGYKKVFVLTSLMVFLLLILTPSRVQTTTERTDYLYNKDITPIFTLSYDHAFDVQLIPVKPETKSQAFYLKEVQNTETGKIEIIEPAIPEVHNYYVLMANPFVPQLNSSKEENVQQFIAAAKRIFADENWRHIDLSLAETVTSEQRMALKEAFTAMIEASDWNNKADALRLAYEDIDWKTLQQDINMQVAHIKLDSIYNSYSSALERYQQIKKEIDSEKHQEINALIADTENILKLADSIRRKRILEL